MEPIPFTFDTQEAAEYLNMSYQKLAGLRRKGAGPTYTQNKSLPGKPYIYRIPDLDAWREAEKKRRHDHYWGTPQSPDLVSNMVWQAANIHLTRDDLTALRKSQVGPPYHQVGRAVKYVAAEVHAWIEERRAMPVIRCEWTEEDKERVLMAHPSIRQDGIQGMAGINAVAAIFRQLPKSSKYVYPFKSKLEDMLGYVSHTQVLIAAVLEGFDFTEDKHRVNVDYRAMELSRYHYQEGEFLFRPTITERELADVEQ